MILFNDFNKLCALLLNGLHILLNYSHTTDINNTEPDLRGAKLIVEGVLSDVSIPCSWAAVNRAALDCQGSSLEFKLHRLHFIDLVSHGPSFQLEALTYARNFAPFAVSHAKGQASQLFHLFYIGSTCVLFCI